MRIGLDEAGRRHGVTGPTVWRWITKGIMVGRQRIKLRGQYEGRRLFTRTDWLDEFHQAVTDAKLALHEDLVDEPDRIGAPDEDQALVAAGIDPAALD